MRVGQKKRLRKKTPNPRTRDSPKLDRTARLLGLGASIATIVRTIFTMVKSWHDAR
jgi:hypothetical protein